MKGDSVTHLNTQHISRREKIRLKSSGNVKTIIMSTLDSNKKSGSTWAKSNEPDEFVNSYHHRGPTSASTHGSHHYFSKRRPDSTNFQSLPQLAQYGDVPSTGKQATNITM